MKCTEPQMNGEFSKLQFLLLIFCDSVVRWWVSGAFSDSVFLIRVHSIEWSTEVLQISQRNLNASICAMNVQQRIHRTGFFFTFKIRQSDSNGEENEMNEKRWSENQMANGVEYCILQTLHSLLNGMMARKNGKKNSLINNAQCTLHTHTNTHAQQSKPQSMKKAEEYCATGALALPTQSCNTPQKPIEDEMRKDWNWNENETSETTAEQPFTENWCDIWSICKECPTQFQVHFDFSSAYVLYSVCIHCWTVTISAPLNSQRINYCPNEFEDNGQMPDHRRNVQ